VGDTIPGDTLQVPDTIPADTVQADTLQVPDTIPGDTVQADTLQVPDTIPPDTVQADTLQVPDTIPPDTLQADTLQVPDTIPGDSAAAQEDSLPPPPQLPVLPDPVPTGWSTAIWEWDREGLLGTRALTLAELLKEVPGLLLLRGGDYGMPVSASFLGGGGGGIRIFLDGFELAPLDGGVVDLSRVSVAGLARVRVERAGGGVEVHLTSLEVPDPRPYTLVEVGTGDLETNLLRATFSHPRVFRGILSLAMDRLETEGTGRREPGSQSAAWIRYALHKGDRGGLVVEWRQVSTDRGTLFTPDELLRRDLVARLRARLADGLVADAFAGRSSLSRGGGDDEGDTISVIRVPDQERSQLGLQLAYQHPDFWASGLARLHGGDGWPENSVALRAGTMFERWGGIEARWWREAWEDETVSSKKVRAWTRPRFGVSFFGEWESGKRGVPLPAFGPPPVEEPPEGEDPTGEDPPPEEPEPEPEAPVRFTDRTAFRYGARFQWRSLSVGAARLQVEADTLVPLGLPMDRDSLVLPGGKRTGLEVNVSLPLRPRGLSLEGTWIRWDDDAAWRYLPSDTWDARLAFHRSFMETGNLEVWSDLGVQGRERMALPFADPEWVPEDPENPGTPDLLTVPFDQSWFFRLQIRIVTVRAFIQWENIAVRDQNQDFPGRRLPATRTIYGVRWTLWN
jgi:hypothetical protein